MGRNALIWITSVILLVSIFNMFNGSSNRSGQVELAYNELLDYTSKQQIDEVLVRGNIVTGKMRDGRSFSSFIPHNTVGLADKLVENGVRVRAANPEENSSYLLQMLFSSFPVILLLLGWFFLLRHMQSGGGKAMGFGKSKAKLLSRQNNKVTFKDVAGIDEAKQELEEIVDFLKDPQKFQRLGGKIPKGAILIGAPGTGKTLLARAIAGEADVPFFSISGSDFVEMFVGVGASRVRDMFEQGKKNAPCIIFIDEIDAVGRHRGAGLGGGNDEREQTLNQLLVEMDGFESNEGVILIAATNRPDVLDPALLRPGRFDRQVVVPIPDILGRQKILQIHSSQVPLSEDVDLKIIARGTPGFSGADLANLLNESALLAARLDKLFVSMEDIESAKDKIIMGAARNSMVMTDEEKKITAYHEAGHALVSSLLPDSDPIHKATIMPRGRALGMVVRLPETDRISISKATLEADLATSMGGRIAEEIIFGADKITTGASQDFKYATNIARHMVTEWGMSEKLGPVNYTESSQELLIGHAVMQQKNISDKTANDIDEEIKNILHNSLEKARNILEGNIKILHKIAQALLEFETLSGEEITAIIKGKKLSKTSVVTKKSATVKTQGTVPSKAKVSPTKKSTKKIIAEKK